MSTINRGAFGKALWPGVNKWYGEAYAQHKTEYTDLFDSYNSSKAFEEDVGIVGFGLANQLTEGQPVDFDAMQQGFVNRYTHLKYGLGFVITQEMVDDDQYMVVAQKRAKALAFSMQQTREIVAANVYNRAFNSSYTGGDSKELCATDHPNVSGGTWQNELTTAADLSEAALEQACIDIMKWTNDRGLRINVMPQTLILPPELVFDAERILMSPLRQGTGDNDVNALKLMGKFPGGVKVNHYLTDADAWFIRTNAPDGMKHFIRKEDKFSDDNEFTSDNYQYKAVARYSFGWTDPRGIYGSPGA